MVNYKQHILPDYDGFGKDPFGYSILAWYKWGLAQTLNGLPVDITKPPTNEDLNSPVLWLTQARAMSEAARIVIQNIPNMEQLPDFVKGVYHCQYCAIGLMLVGYSLEICLKAMIIMKKGVQEYIAEEKKYKHHNLEKLSEFIPQLSDKDKAILRGLSHFILWSGRYPDPGSGREEKIEEIFKISEDHQFSAKELFEFSLRVMNHSKYIADNL